MGNKWRGSRHLHRVGVFDEILQWHRKVIPWPIRKGIKQFSSKSILEFGTDPLWI